MLLTASPGVLWWPSPSFSFWRYFTSHSCCGDSGWAGLMCVLMSGVLDLSTSLPQVRLHEGLKQVSLLCGEQCSYCTSAVGGRKECSVFLWQRVNGAWTPTSRSRLSTEGPAVSDCGPALSFCGFSRPMWITSRSMCWFLGILFKTT